MVMEYIGWCWMGWKHQKGSDCNGLYKKNCICKDIRIKKAMYQAMVTEPMDGLHVYTYIYFFVLLFTFLLDILSSPRPHLWGSKRPTSVVTPTIPLLFPEPTWPAGSAGARPAPPPSHTLFTFVASFRSETASLTCRHVWHNAASVMTHKICAHLITVFVWRPSRILLGLRC